MPESSHAPVYSFTYNPSCSPFTVSSEKYLAQHPSAEHEYLATGALVFDDSIPATPRILLIQRAASDSMPGRWEIPGGAVDDEDESILHGAARELWEEAALTAARIGPRVGKPHFFASRSGKRICKFGFLVEVASAEGGAALHVKLDPREHQRFVWASEEEARERRVGDWALEFTTLDLEALVLEGFRVRRVVKGGLESC